MIDNQTFKKIQDFIYSEVGINLTEAKKALVSARIGKRMRELSIEKYKDYFHFVENDKGGQELVEFFNAISTNVTNFFREKEHFEKLEVIFYNALKRKQKKFRIWSAACSSGEEPYSIAITIKDILGPKYYDVKVLATDISTKVLSQSLSGIYAEKNMSDVDSQHRLKYFSKINENNEYKYKIKDEIREMVLFKRLNLSKPPFPLNGGLDVIFCRNVMIYFDDFVRKRLVDEFYRLLKPGGFLFVGHSESLASINNPRLVLQNASIYRKAI